MNEHEPYLANDEVIIDKKDDQLLVEKGYVRTSSQVFLQMKDSTVAQNSMNTTTADLKHTVACAEALEFRSQQNTDVDVVKNKEVTEKPTIVIQDPLNILSNKKVTTRSSDCASLPTEHKPNF